jgi:glycosyltransferase involved in cell wall biosynthesis
MRWAPGRKNSSIAGEIPLEIEVSVVVPVLNEAENVAILCSRVRAVLKRHARSYEIIFVADGSSDGTEAAVLKERSRDNRVKLLWLSRTFGHQEALTAGLDYASGAAVITMDGDLQHPPEVLPLLLQEWRQGKAVVTTRRLTTHEVPVLRRWASTAFYKGLNLVSNLNLEDGAADFRLLDRQALAALNSLPERTRFLRGMVDWIGFEHTVVSYEAPPRVAGKSKYNFRLLISFALNAILSFSSTPLYVVAVVGLVIATLSFLYGAFAVLAKLLADVSIAGWSSIVAGVSFLGGLQLISLGLVGAYIARMYEEIKGRPVYIVRKQFGLDQLQSPRPSLRNAGLQRSFQEPAEIRPRTGDAEPDMRRRLDSALEQTEGLESSQGI